MRPVKLTLFAAPYVLMLVSLSPATADCDGDRCGRSGNSSQPNVPQGTDRGDVRSRLKFAKDWQVTATCLPDLQEWQGLGGYGAFAVSQNGESCGYSFDDRSRSSARDRAMRECSARGANCKIIFEK